MVSSRKQGRHVFYCLQDSHVSNSYQAVVEYLDEADVRPDEGRFDKAVIYPKTDLATH